MGQLHCVGGEVSVDVDIPFSKYICNPYDYHLLREPLLPHRHPDDDRYCIVLDIDETLLVVGCHNRDRRAREKQPEHKPDDLCLRPGVVEMLPQLVGHEVILWTAGVAAHAHRTAKLLRSLCPRLELTCIGRDARWYNPCNPYAQGKDLDLLGRPLRKCLIVDNTLACVMPNPGCSVLVSSYWGGEAGRGAMDGLSDLLSQLAFERKLAAADGRPPASVRSFLRNSDLVSVSDHKGVYAFSADRD